MNYKELPLSNTGDEQIYARIDDDGKCRLTCSALNPDFIAWLQEGNQPEPATIVEISLQTE